MEAAVKQILEILKKEQIYPGLKLPDNIDTILQESMSDWQFSVTINNAGIGRRIAILTGGINCDRIETVDRSYEVPAIGGGKLPFPTVTIGTILQLGDQPANFNRFSGMNVNAIAHQRYPNIAGVVSGAKDQYIYNNFTGTNLIKVDSNYGIDQLNAFAKNGLRINQIQFSSNKSEFFSSKIELKQYNPFKNTDIEYINIEDYFLPTNALSTKVIVERPFYVDRNTILVITPATDSLITMTLRCSAMNSMSKLLRECTSTEGLLKIINKEIKK